MAKYKPRILVQGAFLVAPDGSVHFPMNTPMNSSEHFLALNPWELTHDGVKTALDYARKHCMNATYYNEVRDDLEQKLRKHFGIDYHYPILLNTEEGIQIILRQFGFSDTDTQARSIARDYWALRSLPFSYEMKQEEKSTMTGEMLELKLKRIGNDMDGFIRETKQQKKNAAPSFWRRGLQTAADHLDHISQKNFLLVLSPVTAGGIALGIGGAYAGLHPIHTAISAGSLVAASGPAIMYSDKLSKACRKITKYAPALSARTGKKLISAAQRDIDALPSKTQKMMEHIDPIVFIAAYPEYYYGCKHDANREHRNCTGVAYASSNSCFIQHSAFAENDTQTLFEEIRHLVHDKLLKHDYLPQHGGPWRERIKNAFQKDIAESLQAADFVNRYSGKGYFWSDGRYKDNQIGSEAMVACDHIVRTLMDEGKSEEESIAEIAKHLPGTVEEYRKMLQSETQLLEQLSAKERHIAEELIADAPEHLAPAFVSRIGAMKPPYERGNGNSTGTAPLG